MRIYFVTVILQLDTDFCFGVWFRMIYFQMLFLLFNNYLIQLCMVLFGKNCLNAFVRQYLYFSLFGSPINNNYYLIIEKISVKLQWEDCESVWFQIW